MTRELDARAHVVIVGGGFGGLTAAQSLQDAPVRITLVDRTNHHTFQPLLYQIAVAGLSPADIAQPIRSIVRRQENVTVLMAEVASVDLRARRVALADGESLEFDFLIIACGAETSYFGHDDWAGAAPGLKSIEDAIGIRQRVLLAFELAERIDDARARDELLSFVVIGGGPTGVELAGALAELSKFVLDRDFRSINPSSAKVRLLEAGPRILPSFPGDMAESAAAQLRELGVEVHTDARVTSIEPRLVHAGGETFPCSIAMWTAGVRANSLTGTLGVKVDREGRVLVEDDLSIPDAPRAFVIGDAALVLGKDGAPLPGVSPVAIQEAHAVARSIRRALDGRETVPFRYFDKGSMATVGRRRAIAMFNNVHLSGLIAWLAWLVVHIWYLIGFRNRLVVMLTWAWSYVTYRRGARLILNEGLPLAQERLAQEKAARAPGAFKVRAPDVDRTEAHA